MRILIIGNGSTGIDRSTNSFFINNHEGKFLKSVNKIHDMVFVQYTIEYEKNVGMSNFDLLSNGISLEVLPNRKNPLFLLKLIRLIRSRDYLYLFYPGSLGTIIGVLTVLLGKPFGLYIRGEFHDRNLLDKLILKKSRFIFTVSPSFIPSLKKYCDHVEVIKPMLSIKKADISLNRDYTRPKQWNFLNVGRIELRKGIYEILEICKYFTEIKLDFKFHIVGGGDLFTLITEKIRKDDILSNIILHGHIADKIKLMKMYEDANAFIFPSHNEGFPRVLYEAMAKALPIFTTFTGGIPGRLTNRENSIEIPVKNGQGAGKIIESFLKEPNTLKNIGKKGQATLLKILDGSHLSHEELFLNKIKHK